MHSWPKVEIEKHITWNNIHSFPNWKDMEELKKLERTNEKSRINLNYLKVLRHLHHYITL